MRDFTRAWAAALLLALACPVAAQAHKNAPREAGEWIHWVAPWREGVTLRYATEDAETSIGAAGTERSRTTSIETIRIAEARDDGFVQAWSFADSRYEQLEGGEGQEALMQQLIDSMPDLTIEVDLDATGNFVGLRNLDELVARLRPVLGTTFGRMFDAGVESAGGWPEGDEAAAARAGGREFVDGMIDRMTRPEVLGALVSRDAIAYNDAFGAELEAGVPFETDVDIDSPLGGGSVPARVTLLMRPGVPGSDEATLEWTTRMDREQAAAMALAAVEQMYGVDVSDADRAKVVADMSIVDTGFARFRRSTGVPLMMETVRTVVAAGERRVERRRMRLLDDDHGHAWTDDEPLIRSGKAGPAD